MLDKPVKSNKKIALHMDYMKVLSLTGKNYIQLYINSIHSRNAIAKMDAAIKFCLMWKSYIFQKNNLVNNTNESSTVNQNMVSQQINQICTSLISNNTP